MGNSQPNQQQQESYSKDDFNLKANKHHHLGQNNNKNDLASSSSQQSSFRESNKNNNIVNQFNTQKQIGAMSSVGNTINIRSNAKSVDPVTSFQKSNQSDQKSISGNASTRLQIIREETTNSYFRQTSQTPMYTELIVGNRKQVRVYVDKDIEFNLEIANDQLTCGWLLSEVTRRYTEELNRIRNEKEQANMASDNNPPPITNGMVVYPHSPSQKFKRKFIVALKTTDQRESLDYWLTQYERPLEVIEDGEFLVAHFASNDFSIQTVLELVMNRKREVDKKDFQQIKVIGRGGFSRVILVRKKDTGRLYAMKIMKKNKIIREKKLKPILSERKVLEKLNHPFIIKLHWAFQSNEELFFVMDLCTGGEVFFHLNRLKRFSEEQAKFYFSEILLGIEYLHDKNVVYRDIKPENILIDVDGHIRIADFGLSKVIPKRTKSYSFCGSPEYMSPEMLQGAGHDRRVDIYCLGALLFEMLTGLPPFYNKDTNKMYESILNHEVNYPDYLNPQVVNLVQGLLQRDPNKRYQSVQEIRKHSWFKGVNWDDIYHKKVTPLIVPNVKECHIDPDYVELPLDFEESQYKVRLSTERRYSYYYESTLQSKSVTEQSFYNNFFEKNDSGSGVVNLLGGGSSVKSGIQNGSNAYGASVQSEQSQQSQDSNAANHSNLISRQNKNIITGLENFTFIDVPQEEIEIQKQLMKHEKNNEERKLRNQALQNDYLQNQHPKTLSMININSLSSPQQSDKNAKLFTSNIKGSLTDQRGRLMDEEQKNNQEESNKGNFTMSNKSGVTFEGSNQSIAQEFRINESIATVFGPSGQVIGGTNGGTNAIYNIKQTSVLCPPINNNRLTIAEEDDDDDLQSVGGSFHNKIGAATTVTMQEYQDREKSNNFSFKMMQSDDNHFTTPQKTFNEHFMPGSRSNTNTNKKDKQQSSINNFMMNQNTMTTATQSSQYHGPQLSNNFGVNDFTTSQYTITNMEETPRISMGAKNINQQVPQFGRSGSQTHNLVSGSISATQPQFSQQKSQQMQKSMGLKIVSNPSQNFDIIDSSMIERENSLNPYQTDSAFSPKVNKEIASQRKLTDGNPSQTKRERTASQKKKSPLKAKNVASPMKDKPSQSSQPSQQELSFSRIPSIAAQQWPNSTNSAQSNERPNTSQNQKNIIKQPPKKMPQINHKHKPSYSLSPSNIMASQNTYQQQQQQQTIPNQAAIKQNPLINKKQPMIKENKSSINPTTASIGQSQQTKKILTANTPGPKQPGIKSFLKAAMPLTMQQQNLEKQNFDSIQTQTQANINTQGGDTSSEIAYQSQAQMQQESSASKKNILIQRGGPQKFRSMDMTQNLLKKSMGQKGAALKNNVAWKQHLLQIQTSQSPSKDNDQYQQQKIVGKQGEPQAVQMISIVNNKQSEIKATQVQLTSIDINSNINPQQLLNIQGINKTPERKESNLSMDQQSYNAPQTIQSKPQSSLTITSNKRQSDGSQKSSARILPQNMLNSQQSHVLNSFQSHSQQQVQPTPSKQINGLFSTPKGQKMPSGITTINIAGANTITPTNQANSYNTQRVASSSGAIQITHQTSVSSTKSSQKVNVVSTTSASQIKTFGGVSRNETNQKKSNTAQAAFNNKLKKI